MLLGPGGRSHEAVLRARSGNAPPASPGSAALKSSRSAPDGRAAPQGSATAQGICMLCCQNASSMRTVPGAIVGAPRLRSTSLNQSSQRPVGRTRGSPVRARSAL